MRRTAPALSLVLPLALATACGGLSEPETARSAKQRVQNPVISDADFATQVVANTDFGLSVFREVRDSQPNLILSPHSISSALAMLYAGARGDTQTVIAEALNFVLAEGVHPAMNRLDLRLAAAREAVDDEDDLKLRIVNDLWLQREFTLEPSYLDLLAEHYGAGARLLDFAGASELARQTINEWIADQTRDRIQNLFPEGTITPDTRLVLTNAIYFKAKWHAGFDAADTEPGIFHNASGAPVSVPMMTQTEQLRSDVTDAYTAVELPYRGEELALLVVMPTGTTREDFETSLTAQSLAAISSALDSKEVRLHLPRFEFDLGLELNDVLRGLGMSSAFTTAADFTGLRSEGGLQVQAVVHKAFILVDEEGSEAAAATGVSVGIVSLPPPPVEIRIDRPFLFFLRDRVSGAVLFVGRTAELTGSSPS